MGMFRNLGSALRIVREQRLLSQAALAHAAGFGKSQLSKYESGKENPKLDSLEKIFIALNIHPLAFFTLLASLDRELDRLAAPEDSQALELILSSGLLSEGVRTAFEALQSDLLRLHGAVVTDTVRAGIGKGGK